MTSAFRHANQTSPTRSRASYSAEPLGVILQRIRLGMGWSLDTAAERAGEIEPRTIALLEAGEDCHWSTVARYATALGRTLVIEYPHELRHATGVQINARTGLSLTTVYEVQRWLDSRDDSAGIYLSSLTRVLSAYRGGIQVE